MDERFGQHRGDLALGPNLAMTGESRGMDLGHAGGCHAGNITGPPSRDGAASAARR